MFRKLTLILQFALLSLALLEKTENPKLPQNCKEVQEAGTNSSGIYKIHPESAPEAFEVWCDLSTKHGGWISVVSRFDGFENFSRGWHDYKKGFGNLPSEHWLGLDHLYQLTGKQPSELLIEQTDWNMTRVYSHFKKFSIGNESEGYELKILQGYSGDGGNDMIGQRGYKFSTRDKDQDTSKTNCALLNGGGWWYNDCFYILLTGTYRNTSYTHDEDYFHISSLSFHGYLYSPKEVRMMVRV